MLDHGLTHIAFVVKDLDASLSFYRKYANMSVVSRRTAGGDIAEVAWISDLTRPFAIVLIQSASIDDTPLGPFGHLGVACASREEVDRLAAEAEREHRLRRAPQDSGPPVGYWAYLADPDGNTLEISYGQAIAYTTEQAAKAV
jgi:lactoylglutathione lyase